MKKSVLVVLPALLSMTALPVAARANAPVPFPEQFFGPAPVIRWQAGQVDDHNQGFYLDGAFASTVSFNGATYAITFGSGGVTTPPSACAPQADRTRCAQFFKGYFVHGFFGATSDHGWLVTFPDGGSGWFSDVEIGSAAVSNWGPRILDQWGGVNGGPVGTVQAFAGVSYDSMETAYMQQDWSFWVTCWKSGWGCPNPHPLGG